MARITVEDCIDKFPSRFELVLVASQRARKLHSGDDPTVEKDNDKNTVIALREIADSTISVENMKENLIQEYQTVTISDEEEENLELESPELELGSPKEDNKNNDIVSESTQEIEKEMSNLVKSEESEIEEQYVISEGIENVAAPEENLQNQDENIDDNQGETQENSDI